MSNSRHHRQRSEPGRTQDFASGDGHAHGYGYSQAVGYAPGAVEGGERGYGYAEDFAPAQNSNTPVYDYDMYAQQGYHTGAPQQNWGYGGYDSYSSYSAYGSDYHYGNAYSNHESGYSNYENYSNYGNGSEGYADSSTSSYSYSTHQPHRESYSAARNDGYSRYGRRSNYSTRNHINYSSNRSYSSYPSSRQPQSSSQPQGQESFKQRRKSPVYHDYTPDASSTTHSIPPTSYSSQPRSQTNRTSQSPRPEPFLVPPSFSQRKLSRPPMKEKRTKPTDEYLTISSQPSRTLGEASVGIQDTDAVAKARKLIVLDLNGTLVLRGQHRKAAYDHVSPTRGGAPPGPPFHVRSVNPRPYLSTFIEYILHDQTKKWLDAMVWSSAQPRSVDDMVGRSFGKRREELRAVWARDTLGLSNEDYHKKSITLKDLEKPWAELPFSLPGKDNNPSAPHSSPSSPRPAPDESLAQSPSISRASSPAPIPPSSQITSTPSSPPSLENLEEDNRDPYLKQREYHHHSALSTLLIDDSPVKASLQPWNHLCIKEYVAEMRKADLDLLEEEERGMREGEGEGLVGEEGETGEGSKGKKKKKERHRVRLRREAREREAGMTDVVNEGGAQGTGQPEADNVEVPMTSDTAAPVPIAITEESSTSTSTSSQTNHEHADDSAAVPTTIKTDRKYDQTLLAVIGVLDRIRYESNVAGWMRAGGLMRVGHDEAGVMSEVRDSRHGSGAQDAVPTEETPTGPAPEEEARLTEIKADTVKGEVKGKTRLVHTPPTRSREASPLLPSSDSKKRRRVGDVDTVVEAENVLGTRMMEMDTSADGGMQDQREGKTKEGEREAQEVTGVPLESSPPTPKPTHPSSEPGQNEKEDDKPKLWFDHPEVFAHWVARGEKALEELDIAVVAGIHR